MFNLCHLENFSHWKVDQNGGDQFRIEEKPCGSHPLENFTDVKGTPSLFLQRILYTGKYPPPALLSPLSPLFSAGKFKNGQTQMCQIISLNKTASGQIQDGAKMFASVEG